MSRIIPIVVTAGIAAAVLSGCGSLPSPQDAVDGAVENAVEEAIEGATGTEISVGDDVSLPSGWPDLPLPEGQLLSSIAADEIYSLDYQLADESAVQALSDALVSAGFELTSESLGEINVRALANSEWAASMTWYESEDLDGVHLVYAAVPNGAE